MAQRKPAEDTRPCARSSSMPRASNGAPEFLSHSGINQEGSARRRLCAETITGRTLSKQLDALIRTARDEKKCLRDLRP